LGSVLDAAKSRNAAQFVPWWRPFQSVSLPRWQASQLACSLTIGSLGKRKSLEAIGKAADYSFGARLEILRGSPRAVDRNGYCRFPANQGVKGNAAARRRKVWRTSESGHCSQGNERK
jgi:hypothetical protein